MLPVGKIAKEEDAEFCWGEKMTVNNKDVQFYKSFMYDGVTYALFDSVYVWCGDEPEPSIGKMVKMWETSTHQKKVKIVWYFRPCEITHFLRDVKPLEKEIFLACGEGKGLFNIGSPEAIAGKCKVVCVTADERNLQVSGEELGMANQVFFRTFNVGNFEISEIFPGEIAGLEVLQYFNREKDRNLKGPVLEEKNRKLIVRVKRLSTVGNSIKDVPKLEEDRLCKQTCSSFDNDSNSLTKSFSKVWPENDPSSCKEEGTTDIWPLKRRKVHFNTVVENLEPSKGWLSNEKEEKFTDTYSAGEKHVRGPKTCSKPFVVTRRPHEETSKWFRQQPWKVKLQRAHETGALLLLENLNPTYTSSEIEDIVWNALDKKVNAQMIQRTIPSNPHYGKALVIFKSKDAAEAAISELTKKCLVLTDGRPVVASRGYPKNLNDKTKFYGHLIIDRIRYQRQYDQMKGPASTSHYSQPNTIEHELALEWCALQEKSILSWNALNQQQEKERDELQRKLKTHDEEGLHENI